MYAYFLTSYGAKKMYRLLSIFLSGTLLFLASSQAYAEKYHGELCWQVFSDSRDPLWKYKFGVYEKEGGHIALFGSIDYGPNGLSASHGNAIILGNVIKMTIVSTDYEESEKQVWNETVAVKLDKATLDGTWNTLSLENNDGEDEILGFRDKGTIELIAYP